MSRSLAKHELRMVGVTLTTAPQCVYCGERFGEGGTQTLAELVQATTQHRPACRVWPTPRSRTAQCRPMAGQTAIPLPE